MFDKLASDQKLVQFVLGKAKEIAESGIELVPMLAVVCGDGVSFVGFEDFSRVHEHFQEVVPQLLKKLDADECMFVFEAWTARVKPGDEVIKPSMMPLDDRSESVMASFYTKSGSMSIAEAKITHGPNRTRVIHDFVELDPDKIEGRLMLHGW